MDSGEGGLSQNLVKFQSISRMNAVLAVTRKPEALRQVQTWIRRLDAADTARSGVHVYRVKFGEARNMAACSTNIFLGGGGSTSSLDSTAGQIAPGSGLSSSSSASSATNRLSAGGGGSQSSSSGLGGRSQQQSGGSGSGSGSSGAAASRAVLPPRPGAALSRAVSSKIAAAVCSTAGAGAARGRDERRQCAPAAEQRPHHGRQRQQLAADLCEPAGLQHHRETIRQIDRPQLQVGIEATIAEVTLNDDLSYGVQFFLASRNIGLPADTGSALNTTALSGPAAATAATTAASAAGSVVNAFINRALPGFNFLIGPELSPNTILDALHTVTDVKVLSNPSVVVIDNQVATLQVGDEVPFSTGSATVLTTSNTVVNTIDYRNTGIILRVLPRVNANGNVRLDIEQEISNVPQRRQHRAR